MFNTYSIRRYLNSQSANELVYQSVSDILYTGLGVSSIDNFGDDKSVFSAPFPLINTAACTYSTSLELMELSILMDQSIQTQQFLNTPSNLL